MYAVYYKLEMNTGMEFPIGMEIRLHSLMGMGRSGNERTCRGLDGNGNDFQSRGKIPTDFATVVDLHYSM